MDFLNQVEKGYASAAYDNRIEPARPYSIREQIQRQAEAHKTELKRLDEMLTLIDENPAIEKFINLQRGV